MLSRKRGTPSRDLFAAVRAETKPGFENMAALRAAALRRDHRAAPCFLSRLTKETSATLTLNERISFSNTENRNEKEREIVIHPFQAGLIQSAGGTHSRMAVDLNGFWLNPAYEEKHTLPLLPETYGFSLPRP